MMAASRCITGLCCWRRGERRGRGVAVAGGGSFSSSWVIVGRLAFGVGILVCASRSMLDDQVGTVEGLAGWYGGRVRSVAACWSRMVWRRFMDMVLALFRLLLMLCPWAIRFALARVKGGILLGVSLGTEVGGTVDVLVGAGWVLSGGIMVG